MGLFDSTFLIYVLGGTWTRVRVCRTVCCLTVWTTQVRLCQIHLCATEIWSEKLSYFWQQKLLSTNISVTRMHSSRMCTARSSSRPGGGGVSTYIPLGPAPPPGPGPPVPGTPRARHPPLWTEFLTHACENITFPQTSFAGCKTPFISWTYHKDVRCVGCWVWNTPGMAPSCTALQAVNLTHSITTVLQRGWAGGPLLT